MFNANKMEDDYTDQQMAEVGVVVMFTVIVTAIVTSGIWSML